MKKTLLLLTLAALLLVGCADMSDPSRTLATEATTTAVTTEERDVITNPESLSEIELEIVRAMWAKYKHRATAAYTIDTVANYMPRSWLTSCGDGYALFVLDFGFPGLTLTQEKIGGYEFRYTSTDTLDYYQDGEFYTLAEAYNLGKVTDEEIRTLWEAYRASYQASYD